MLLVDDDQERLDLIKDLLCKKVRIEIDTTNLPSKAIQMAQKSFYDLVILDVTMHYQDNQYGGLDLCKTLSNRYGHDSIIVYSQQITDEQLKNHNYPFNFIETGNNLLQFVDKLYAMMIDLRKKQTCFVAMPFNKKFDLIYDSIRPCIEGQNYRCRQVDKGRFTSSIIKEIFDQIRNCKLLIFFTTDKNPRLLTGFKEVKGI